jgi:transposase-like protein
MAGKGNHRKIEGLSKEKLRRLYSEERSAVGEIARRFGCSVSAVRSELMRTGLLIIKSKVGPNYSVAQKIKLIHLRTFNEVKEQ